MSDEQTHPTSSPTGGRSWSACASRASSRSRTASRTAPRSPRSASPTENLEPGEETSDRYRIAGRHHRAPRARQGRLPRPEGRHRRDPGAGEGRRARRGLRGTALAGHRRHRRHRGNRLRVEARRAVDPCRGLGAALEEPAAAAREVPRPGGRRDPLPAPRARPDGERGDPRALPEESAHHRRGEALVRRPRLRRGRDARAPAPLRRGAGPAVHDAPQRPRPRPLSADRDRALPEAPGGRRHREGLRARQGLPQRGHLAQAQPRVHDARVVRGLRGLQRHRHRARGAGLGRGAGGPRHHEGRARRGDHRPVAALASHHASATRSRRRPGST